MPTRASVSSKKSKALIPGKFLLPIFVGILVVVGLIAALILSTVNQDNRQQASVGAPPVTYRTCHRTVNGACQTFYVTTSTCGTAYSGACPAVQVTCSAPGACTGGPCGGQGVQTQTCSDGSIRQSYCTMAACGGALQPTSTPILPTPPAPGGNGSCLPLKTGSECFTDANPTASFVCFQCKSCPKSGTYTTKVNSAGKTVKVCL